jgi:hypothetical protein
MSLQSILAKINLSYIGSARIPVLPYFQTQHLEFRQKRQND